MKRFCAVALFLLLGCLTTSGQDPDKPPKPAPQEPDKPKPKPPEPKPDDRKPDDRKKEPPPKPDERHPQPPPHPDDRRQQPPPRPDERRPPEQQPNHQPEHQRQQAEGRREEGRAAHPAPPPARREGYEARESRRIPEERYRAEFGREHHFRVRFENEQPRFAYSGYYFEYVDPWPADWDYYDDLFYIDYFDGGYYLYDLTRPGTRILVILVD
jgi:hypothetical protein